MDFQLLDRAVESGSFDPKLTPPRLPVYSLAKKPDPLGMTTPPIGPQGAIPFQWEQAPGKPKSEVKLEPKRRNHSSAWTTSTRLGLPPKMAARPAAKEKRISKTTPASCAFSSSSSMRDALRQRSASLTSLSSLVKGRHSSSPSFSSSISSFVKGRCSVAKDDSSFAKEGKEWREDKGEANINISPCYSASSSQSSSNSLTSPFSSCTGGEEESDEEEREEVVIKVRITRYERERTLTCHTASDFWTKISGRLQAAVPWRRDIKM